MLVSILIAQLALTSPYVVDGDTLRAGGETYRLIGIDAPEVRGAACPAERAVADAATARVRDLVAAAIEIRAIPGYDPKGRRVWPRDRYQRRLARIEIDGRDLGDQLIAEGLAVVWTPQTPHDWCAP